MFIAWNNDFESVVNKTHSFDQRHFDKLSVKVTTSLNWTRKSYRYFDQSFETITYSKECLKDMENMTLKSLQNNILSHREKASSFIS